MSVHSVEYSLLHVIDVILCSAAMQVALVSRALPGTQAARLLSTLATRLESGRAIGTVTSELHRHY